MFMASTIAPSRKKMSLAGASFRNLVHYQQTPESLVRATLRLKEGSLSDSGALVIHTGKFTGRSPKDKFTVMDELTRDTVHWNEFNIAIQPEKYALIYQKISDYLNGLPELWIRDCTACADIRYRLNLRLVSEKPWTSLFAYNMFLRPSASELDGFDPEWTILSAPGLLLDPIECGVRQSNATIINFTTKTILIAGSGYTGETKKGIFSILNYILPLHKGVLSMHCSANKGRNGDTALFFGLSGTGKTTLSADPSRQLIGDDEHGWSNTGIFNFEGGCYAKTIDLSPEKEPEIFDAIRAGALVENTSYFKDTNTIDFSSSAITENTRVSYPLGFISNACDPSMGDTPANIFFLTCDACGILPPVSRLSPAQAMYQFISGYTAKVAGTETGITEPVLTFSACFGAPFLPLHPGKYASMLGEKMRKNKVKVWLINTGWTGGAYGTGTRIKLSYTRAMITAILRGELEAVGYSRHPVFGIEIPFSCPGVPSDLLSPRHTWADKAMYDQKAIDLANKFINNFKKYAGVADQEIIDAGPIV